MNIFPKNALPGDLARRRGLLYLLLTLSATPFSIWIFSHHEPLWALIAPLQGMLFTLAAVLFGVLLAVAPVAAVVGGLLATWFGVESIFMPRTRRAPIADFLIVCAGLVVWFLPALGFLAFAIRAVILGRVHLTQPARDYLRAEDPIAYWQSIGFFLIAAAVFTWLAWRYWRGKFRRENTPDK